MFSYGKKMKVELARLEGTVIVLADFVVVVVDIVVVVVVDIVVVLVNVVILALVVTGHIIFRCGK